MTFLAGEMYILSGFAILPFEYKFESWTLYPSKEIFDFFNFEVEEGFIVIKKINEVLK